MKRRQLFKNIKKTWIACSLMAVFIACHQRMHDGPAIEEQVLKEYGLRRDDSNDSLLQSVVRGINCIAVKELKIKLVFARNFSGFDSNEILVIPFRSLLGDFSSCAYSDIKDHFILVSPQLVDHFNDVNSLNATTSLQAVMSIIFLHELGHFVLGRAGDFDVIDSFSNDNHTGETRINNTPEYITSQKKLELSADSIGIALVKKYASNYKEMDCYNVASGIERVLPGIEFELFGKRMIDHFGSRTINFLHDPAKTHPNLELRIAFMNYFLSGSPEQKQMIDDYLYEREVAPVHRQETDPLIFQGLEKILPGDTIRSN